MANKSIVSNSLLNAIAQAISEADGGSSTMQLSDMPTRIQAISSGGSNGEYDKRFARTSDDGDVDDSGVSDTQGI